MNGILFATKSLGESLSLALQHTAIGMGTVFVVLIIMICVISLFKFIPNPDAKKKAESKPAAPVKVEEVTAEPEVEEETDDLALIAVITAAVAASMGTTDTNGFVVRSVKRVKSSNWKKA